MLERVEALRLTGSKPPRYPYGYASSSSGTLVLESEVLNNREGDAFDAVKKAYDGIRSMRVALLDEDGQGKRKAAVEFAFASEEMRSCALEKPVYFEKCDCVWPMPTFPAKPICLLIDIVGLPLEDDENVAREKIMKSVPTLFVHWPAQNINPNVLDTVPGKLPSSGIYNGNMAVVLEGAPEIPKKRCNGISCTSKIMEVTSALHEKNSTSTVVSAEPLTVIKRRTVCLSTSH